MAQTLLNRHGKEQWCIETILRQAGIPAPECPALKPHPYAAKEMVPACRTQAVIRGVSFKLDYNSQNESLEGPTYTFIQLDSPVMNSEKREVKRTLLKWRVLTPEVTLVYADLESLKKRYDMLVPMAANYGKWRAAEKAREDAVQREVSRKNSIAKSIVERLGISNTARLLAGNGEPYVQTQAEWAEQPKDVTWRLEMRINNQETLRAVLAAFNGAGTPVVAEVALTDNRLSDVAVNRVRMPKPWKG